MPYLIASILILLAGPLSYRYLSSKEKAIKLVDGFNFITITGIVLLGIFPHLAESNLFIAFAALATGFFLPLVIERLLIGSVEVTHKGSLLLGVVGLSLHAVMDGIPFAEMVSSSNDSLPIAILAHRLPVALLIWWLIRPRLGMVVASITLLIIASFTVAGYYLGETLGPMLEQQGSLVFQTFVSGALLHVLFHKPKWSHEVIDTTDESWLAGIGGLIGIAVVVVLFFDMGESEFMQNAWELMLASAPAILLGYFLAALIQAFMPGNYVSWLGRGSRSWQSTKGALVGLPVPICSCGVVPVYETLVKRGAPMAASTSFLIATPELGIDAIIISIPFLGAEFTIVRVIAAALVAILVGYILSLFFNEKEKAPIHETAHEKENPGPQKTFKQKLRHGFTFGFGEVLDHTSPWILLGILIAAAIQILITPTAFAQLNPVAGVVLAALVGIPMYVCASGATPFVAILVLKGLSPGAALAFLLTGPATNVTTFGIIRNLHGSKVALAFSLLMIGLSVILGLLVNLAFGPGLAQVQSTLFEEATTWWHHLSVYILGAAFLFSFARRGGRSFLNEILKPFAGHDHGHGHSH